GPGLATIAAVVLACTTAHAEPRSLDTTLEPYLARYALPALAAAVVRDGEVIAAGAVGTRRIGTQASVTIDDRFHLGSDTQAMTALLAAMDVEAGTLRWDSTVAEVLPEMRLQMDPRLRGVTLTQLLSHTSGVPADNPAVIDLIDKWSVRDGNLDVLRAGLIGEWVALPLANPPGATFTYANMNYVLVGVMLERISGRTWDELITERVFTPLGLRSAGLGPQSSLGRVDAPLGHAVVDGKTTAFLAGPDGDNPAILGPAGIAHMSVLDFARWAGWNAGEGKRGPQLVQAETMRTLHTKVISMARPDAPPGTPPSGGYGLGWGELEVDWAPAPLLFHGGSNGKNLAHIWVEPSRDLAIVLMTNISNPQADEGLRALAAALYGTYLAAGAPALPTAAPTLAPTRPP
ncbi:MAG: serine hydrolase domain-containing protein, partial [Myxococcota bacterium]